MGPTFMDFFNKKTDPKIWHIPVCLKCEYPPMRTLYVRLILFLFFLNFFFLPRSLPLRTTPDPHH